MEILNSVIGKVQEQYIYSTQRVADNTRQEGPEAANVAVPTRSDSLTILPPDGGESLLYKYEREIINKQQINITLGKAIPDILDADLPRAGEPRLLNEIDLQVMGELFKATDANRVAVSDSTLP